MANENNGGILRSLGCKVVSWYLAIAVLGIAASATFNYLWMTWEYATDPTDNYILVGGVTSTSASFRIRLTQNGVPRGDNSRDDSKLIIAQDVSLFSVVSEHSLVNNEPETQQASESSQQAASNLAYGLHAITATNLEPERFYYYGVRSSYYGTTLQGRFQTPASEGTRYNFTIAAAGCAWTGSKQNIFDLIRRDNSVLQFMVHLGDFHYEGIDTDSLTQRLDAVSTVLDSAPQAQLYRNVPLVYTWDDHDYVGDEKPNYEPPLAAVRESAQLSYQQAFPHYPLGAAATDDSNATITPVPIYHAFTIGTVRFIVSDLISDKSSTSIYSQQQQEWFFNELQQASQYDFVIWVTSKPWIGSETSSNADSVAGSWIDSSYSQDRTTLSNLITEAIAGDNGPRNLLVVSGDAHMQAFDMGKNTYYGDDVNGAYSFPILQSAPLDRLGSTKGGPFTDGCKGFMVERTHQYSTLTFQFVPDQDPCIDIESFQVDDWGYSRRIFEKQLCGQIFEPGDPANSVPVDDQYCRISWTSEITMAFYIVSAVSCFSLAFGTCLVITTEPESQQGWVTRMCCGMFATLIAWGTASVILYIAVLIPVTNDIGQYDLRWSFVISLSTTVLMAFVLFVIFCCCSKKKPTEQEKENETNLHYVDPIVQSTKSPVIVMPSVFRTPATNNVDDEDRLPQGVILTGGAKLHKAGLKGAGVRVAVIDSGVDQEHPGFRGQVKVKNWFRSGTPLEEDDHGTHVAGTIHMMAPEAEIHDYRVFGKEGSLSVDQAIAKSIRNATDAKCQVINMSLGGPFPNDSIWEAVQYASNKGVVMVCAAGNEGDNNPLTNEVSFPASYKECLSIAAVAKAEGLPVAVFSNSNPLIDYAGIGVDVTSFQPGGGFQNMSGTSMASPHVAGLIACLMTNGQISSESVKATLDGLAIDIDVAGVDNATGVGFVSYLDSAEFDRIMPRKEGITPAPPPVEEGIEIKAGTDPPGGALRASSVALNGDDVLHA